MKVALPTSQGRISPVLDTASRMLVVTLCRGKEVDRTECVLSPLSTDALASGLAELHADVLLCAALSEPLLDALAQKGVKVRPHLCGEADEVLKAFCHGSLERDEFRMPGCWGLHWGGKCRRRRPHPAKKPGKLSSEPLPQSPSNELSGSGYSS